MIEIETARQQFWRFAMEFCDTVQDFQPDVILVLMHSARMPFIAGETLWKTVNSQPLPPVVFTNLGREKMDAFDENVKNPYGLAGHFVGDYENDLSKAFFLAWLADQTAWQDELRTQVRGQAGDDGPQRILIVDDLIHEGSTSILTLGLLSLVYPKAQTRFVEMGSAGWEEPILKAWAAVFQPKLAELEIIRPPAKGDYLPVLWLPGKYMVLGSEDISESSLGWREITLDSPLMQELSELLPPEDWLSLPGWAADYVRQEIIRRAGEYVPGTVPLKKRSPFVSLSHFILRDLFRYEELSVKDVAQRFGLSPRQTRLALLKLMDKGAFVVTRKGRENRYVASPSLKSRNRIAETPLMETYWAIPGQLLVGEFPGWDSDVEDCPLVSRLDWLMAQGVTFFFDLSTRDRWQIKSYQRVLESRAKSKGKSLVYRAMPTPERRLPARARVVEILKTIEDAIRDGHVVYMHSRWMGGVEDVLAGCVLVERGMSGQQALEALNQARAGLFDGWRRAPYKETGRRLVRRWRKNGYP